MQHELSLLDSSIEIQDPEPGQGKEQNLVPGPQK